MSDAVVLVSRHERVATVTLNRPDKRNALNSDTVLGLTGAFAALDRDDDVRVIILTGAGSDFCAGADLAQLEQIAAGADSLSNLEDAQQLGSLFVAMRRAAKPIVAAVRGNALAGGAGLALACDIVLAAEDAVFGYPEVHLGFVPAMVMAILRRAVGEKVAFELVARGHRLSAGEAQRFGLVNHVFDTQTFGDDVAAYTADLAKRSGSATLLTKRLLYGMDGLGFEEAIARGAEVNALARATEDCRTGVRRFLDRNSR